MCLEGVVYCGNTGCNQQVKQKEVNVCYLNAIYASSANNQLATVAVVMYMTLFSLFTVERAPTNTVCC